MYSRFKKEFVKIKNFCPVNISKGETVQSWIEIPEFEKYSIGTNGDVRRNFDGYVLAKFRNKQGLLYVALHKQGRQYMRALAPMVADAFLPPPQHRSWNTPIHLNGDRSDIHYTNLMWRPRWFAVQYHRQVPDTTSQQYQLRETQSGEVMSLMEFAMKYGILPDQLYLQAYNYTHHGNTWDKTWPVRLVFEML